MPPPKRQLKKTSFLQNVFTKLSEFSHPSKWKKLGEELLFNPDKLWMIASLLLIAEIGVNIVVILKVNYTEIDWVAYMSEVEGFLNGTRDYTKLEGATGPLVYPAGFVYLFSGLYYLTGSGRNIRLAQYVFAVLYLLMLCMVFYMYQKIKKVPPYVMCFVCCASYRIHSIFILRLFNDPVAMLFLYASVISFMKNHWSVGCALFSFGVSIKMNVLLFAPGLLLLLLIKFGIAGSVKKIFICAVIQLGLGLPFLLENPVGYIVRSFNLGRQFFFVWTVNWRFIPEWLFLSRSFQSSLLILHLIFLCIFVYKKWPAPANGWSSIFHSQFLTREVSEYEIIKVMFTCNFIGMCFARSLHYQFYVWYFHTLPFLLWSIKIPSVVRLLLLGLVELSWNTYPSTNFSSALLHFCHIFILCGMLLLGDERKSTEEKSK